MPAITRNLVSHEENKGRTLNIGHRLGYHLTASLHGTYNFRFAICAPATLASLLAKSGRCEAGNRSLPLIEQLLIDIVLT